MKETILILCGITYVILFIAEVVTRRKTTISLSLFIRAFRCIIILGGVGLHFVLEGMGADGRNIDIIIGVVFILYGFGSTTLYLTASKKIKRHEASEA